MIATDTPDIPSTPPGVGLAQARFRLGQVVLTEGAAAVLSQQEIAADELLGRHIVGDWGDLPEADKRLNEQALTEQQRLLSSYRLLNGETVWVITEADRSTTTLLLPSEY